MFCWEVFPTNYLWIQHQRSDLKSYSRLPFLQNQFRTDKQTKGKQFNEPFVSNWYIENMSNILWQFRTRIKYLLIMKSKGLLTFFTSIWRLPHFHSIITTYIFLANVDKTELGGLSKLDSHNMYFCNSLRLRDQFLFPEFREEVHVHGRFVTGKSWTLYIMLLLNISISIFTFYTLSYGMPFVSKILLTIRKPLH